MGGSALRIGVASEWIGDQVGGLERYADCLIRALVETDDATRFELFLTPGGRGRMADLASERVRVHATPRDSRWHYVPLGLPRLARRYPVDVLHATFSVVPWCPARRVLLTIHDLCPDVYPEFFPAPVRARFRWLIGQSIRRADHIVTPSETARDELLAHHAVDPARVTAIAHGVTPAVPPDAAAPLDDDEKRALDGLPSEFVLYVGRFHARKNLLRLIDAMAELRDRRAEPVPLVIVGRDLWGERDLRDRIAARELDAHVFFPGYASDALLGHIYPRARAFAFPSLHEGFGIPLLEAMQHGVPVVTSNVSCLPEVCGSAGVLVDPLDPSAIADGVAQVLDDTALRERLIAAGYERVRDYTWQRSAHRHLDLYRQLAGPGAGARS